MHDIDNFIEFCNDMCIVEESILINKTDIEYLFDDWKSGKSNVLLVTGLSGSGKSTISKEYEEMYNAPIFELDAFEHNRKFFTFTKNVKKSETLTFGNLYFTQRFNGPKDWSTVGSSEYVDELYQYIQAIINYTKSNSSKRYIIEGIQIFRLASSYPDLFDGLPCIIKGTSLVTSMTRALKRTGVKDTLYDKSPLQYLDWCLDLNKKLDIFKKARK